MRQVVGSSTTYICRAVAQHRGGGKVVDDAAGHWTRCALPPRLPLPVPRPQGPTANAKDRGRDKIAPLPARVVCEGGALGGDAGPPGGPSSAPVWVGV